MHSTGQANAGGIIKKFVLKVLEGLTVAAITALAGALWAQWPVVVANTENMNRGPLSFIPVPVFAVLLCALFTAMLLGGVFTVFAASMGTLFTVVLLFGKADEGESKLAQLAKTLPGMVILGVIAVFILWQFPDIWRDLSYLFTKHDK